MSKKKKNKFDFIPYEDRAELCPCFGLCGGCAFQKISYAGQLVLKSKKRKGFFAVYMKISYLKALSQVLKRPDTETKWNSLSEISARTVRLPWGFTKGKLDEHRGYQGLRPCPPGYESDPQCCPGLFCVHSMKKRKSTLKITRHREVSAAFVIAPRGKDC